MTNRIHYLNTDLEVSTSFEPAPLTSALGAPEHFHLLAMFQREDGSWLARLGTWTDHDHPEVTIGEWLDAIERLPADARAIWDACGSRELDVGYECELQPKEISHAIPSPTLARMSVLGLGLRFTLYRAHAPA